MISIHQILWTMVVPGKNSLCMIRIDIFLSLRSTIKNLRYNTSPFFQHKPNTQGPYHRVFIHKRHIRYLLIVDHSGVADP
jgi:hypothetical protein